MSSTTARAGGATETPPIGHEFRYFGDRFRILRLSRGTDDGRVRADCFAAPAHVHRNQEERLEE